MPLPPDYWSQHQIDAHWESGHGFHVEELRALQQAHDPYLRLMQLAKRCYLHFQSFEDYDLELIVGNFFMMLTEHDTIIALKDGLWLPGMKKLPQSFTTKRIPVRKPYYRRLCYNAWRNVGDHILQHPTSVLIPEYARPVTLTPHGWNAIRFVVLQRDGYRCQLCGVAALDGVSVRLHVDHKIARANGGGDTEDNLWTLCSLCNEGKGTKDL